MNSHPVSAAPLSPSPPCISTGYTIDDISIAPQHLQDITNHTQRTEVIIIFPHTHTVERRPPITAHSYSLTTSAQTAWKTQKENIQTKKSVLLAVMEKGLILAMTPVSMMTGPM